jgi:hypothetical protein
MVEICGAHAQRRTCALSLLSFRARLTLPRCAAALGLRADVPAARLTAPYRNVDAMAEVAAREAAAGMVGVRIEGCESHGAIVTNATRCEQ